MTLEKLRYLATEFLKIFFFYLGIRLFLQLLNQKPFSLQVILFDHIPLAALFASLYAIIRMVLMKAKK
jgi:hypothetical protein